MASRSGGGGSKGDEGHSRGASQSGSGTNSKSSKVLTTNSGNARKSQTNLLQYFGSAASNKTPLSARKRKNQHCFQSMSKNGHENMKKYNEKRSKKSADKENRNNGNDSDASSENDVQEVTADDEIIDLDTSRSQSPLSASISDDDDIEDEVNPWENETVDDVSHDANANKGKRNNGKTKKPSDDRDAAYYLKYWKEGGKEFWWAVPCPSNSKKVSCVMCRSAIWI